MEFYTELVAVKSQECMVFNLRATSFVSFKGLKNTYTKKVFALLT